MSAPGDVPAVPAAARQISPQELFAYLGGGRVFDELVAGFYRRVRTDDVLAPMYPQDDWAGAERRLRTFLEQYWGGPDTYGRERGAPMLRRRHDQSVTRPRYRGIPVAAAGDDDQEAR